MAHRESHRTYGLCQPQPGKGFSCLWKPTVKGHNLGQLLETSNHDSEWPGKTWVNSKAKPCQYFSEPPYISITYSSDTSRPPLKLHRAQQGLLSGTCCLPRSPLLWNSILIRTILWLHKLCSSGVGGLFCTASSQSSCHGLIVSMLWARGAHSPWNGFLGPSNVTSGGWDTLAPA